MLDGWCKEEPGWWVHETLGGICREQDGKWYGYPKTLPESERLGPFNSATTVAESMQAQANAWAPWAPGDDRLFAD